MLYFYYFRLQTIAKIKTNLISTSCSLLWIWISGSMFAPGLSLSRCCTSSNIIAAIIITTGNYLNVFGKHRCWGKQNKWSLLQCHNANPPFCTCTASEVSFMQWCKVVSGLQSRRFHTEYIILMSPLKVVSMYQEHSWRNKTCNWIS